jgi:hypothetical protein
MGRRSAAAGPAAPSFQLRLEGRPDLLGKCAQAWPPLTILLDPSSHGVQP